MTANELHADLKRLIDARLEEIDQVLCTAGVDWSNRRDIVGEVETQVFELLSRRAENPSESDVVDVLASLDSPESFVPEEDREVYSRREWSMWAVANAKRFGAVAGGVTVLAIANVVVVLVIGASGGVIQWFVTLGALAWCNYELIRRYRSRSARSPAVTLHRWRTSLASWLMPSNGAPAA